MGCCFGRNSCCDEEQTPLMKKKGEKQQRKSQQNGCCCNIWCKIACFICCKDCCCKCCCDVNDRYKQSLMSAKEPPEEVEALKREVSNKDCEIVDLRQSLDGKISEVKELTTKLAAEMSSKISADESSVENVSIKNRPMNVAEEYQMLCSNQWLDAKSELDNYDATEEDRLQLLHHIIKVCYEEAQNAKRDMMQKLVELLTVHGKLHEQEKSILTKESANLKQIQPTLKQVASDQVEREMFINRDDIEVGESETTVQTEDVIVHTGEMDDVTTEVAPSLKHKGVQDEKHKEENGPETILQEEDFVVNTEKSVTTVTDTAAIGDFCMKEHSHEVQDTLTSTQPEQIPEDVVINTDGSDKQDQQNVEQSMLQARHTEPSGLMKNKEYQVSISVETDNVIGDFLRKNSDDCPLDKQIMAVFVNINKESESLSTASYLQLWMKCKHLEGLETFISAMVRATWKMVLQRPPMVFLHSDKYLGETYQELYWKSVKSETSIGIEVYPMLYHGKSLMAKGKIFLVE